MNEIVVGVDGSDESRAALAWAVEEGRLRQAPVLAIHAWALPVIATPSGLGPPSVDVVGELTELKQGAQELIETIVSEVAGNASDVEVRPLAVEQRPASALLDAAEEHGAQLIVVGSRGHGGFVSLLIGSVSEQVARHASCPVVIHRQQRG